MYIFNAKDACFGDSPFEAAKHTNVECGLHIHYNMEIVYVKRGTVIMNVSGMDRLVRSGQATLIMPFEKHSFATPDFSECFVIIFSPEMILDFFSEIKNKVISSDSCVFSPDASVMEYCQKALHGKFVEATDSFIAKRSEYASCDLFCTKSILYSLCWQITQKCTFLPASKPLHFNKAFIEAISYVGNNISADLSLFAVSKALGIHHVYLSRIFRQNCGMSYTEYVNSLRCSYSARLLRNKTLNEMTIAQIAYEAGFGSIRSYNRKFKEFYGVTPGDYRENTNLV